MRIQLARLFSIKRGPTFAILAMALAAFSIAAWWSVKTLVEADIHSRLEAQTDRVEAVFRARMLAYAQGLSYMRGYFLAQGTPSKEEFGKYVDSLDVSKRLPGLRRVGFAPVVKSPSESGVQPGVQSGVHTKTALITMLEPSDLTNRRVLGFDLLTDPARRAAILMSAETGEPVMTSPVTLLRDESEGGRGRGLIVVLPVYKPAPLSKAPDALDDVTGILIASLSAQDIFEGIFGSPSLSGESINFVLKGWTEDGSQSSLYNRFDTLPNEDSVKAAVDRHFKLLGRTMALEISPLPHFYTQSDRFLPAITGFSATFISILVLIVMKASQSQLVTATRAREVSNEAAKRSRAQAEIMRRLNESAQSVSSELDKEALLTKVANLGPRLLRAEVSLLYFGPEKAEGASLFDHRGIASEHVRAAQVSCTEIRDALGERNLLRRKDRSILGLTNLLFEEVPAGDWVAIGLPARDARLCGLVFLARHEPFDDIEIETLESFVNQAAIAIENARLYRKADEANKAKNAFLANMSHEIRTPLNAIIGFSEMLLRKDMNETQRETLSSNLRKGGSQLTRLIDDILDFSKIEAGRFSIDKRKVALGPLLREIKSVIEMRAVEKAIVFRIAAENDLPTHVLTDEVRLKQILLNLVGNAIKFTEKGTVDLAVRFTKADDGRNLLIFRVTDTGIGISRDAQLRLFKPFSQADVTATRKFGGSGLGLALSRRLAIEMGGDLALTESQVGTGSTFEVVLSAGELSNVHWGERLLAKPPELEKPVVSAKAASARSLLKGVRILLVEDSPDNQEIFLFFLENAGADVTIVDNGLSAVGEALRGEYDIVLMDIQIPEIDGKEATRRIRREGFKKPIVALTAHALKEERESCLNAGCSGHITKPISGAALISEVSDYIRSSTDGRSNGESAGDHRRDEAQVH